jgi:hypothetical protein
MIMLSGKNLLQYWQKFLAFVSVVVTMVSTAELGVETHNVEMELPVLQVLIFVTLGDS